MITFNTRHTVDEPNIDRALHKLMAAHIRLGTPLVITDTWLQDGKPIPQSVCQIAIWRYERKHGGRHPGISFVVGDQGMQTLISNLTRVCKVEERTVRDAIDKAMHDIEARGFATPRYSITKPVAQIPYTDTPLCPGTGRQAHAFDEMRRPSMSVPDALRHQLAHYQCYFDVREWNWIYNTVRFTAGPLT